MNSSKIRQQIHQQIDQLSPDLLVLFADFLDFLVFKQAKAEEKTLYEIREKLRHYEQQYNMTSEQFYQQFLTGELGDSSDYVDWAGFYEQIVVSTQATQPVLE